MSVTPSSSKSAAATPMPALAKPWSSMAQPHSSASSRNRRWPSGPVSFNHSWFGMPSLATNTSTPAILVEVRAGYAQPVAERRAESRALGYVRERAVAVVPVESVRGRVVGRGTAIGSHAVLRGSRRPTQVVDDKQVEIVVPIEVQERGRRPPPRIADARRLRDVVEPAAAVVAQEDVRPPVGDVRDPRRRRCRSRPQSRPSRSRGRQRLLDKMPLRNDHRRRSGRVRCQACPRRRSGFPPAPSRHRDRRRRRHPPAQPRRS